MLFHVTRDHFRRMVMVVTKNLSKLRSIFQTRILSEKNIGNHILLRNVPLACFGILWLLCVEKVSNYEHDWREREGKWLNISK